jgi:tetratricopeptide (TPR) repeat protein
MPGDPTTLNGLGYAYAQAGQNLDEALKLTTRAVEIARKNNAPDELVGSIIDSLGWVYFKLGDSEDAMRYLSAATDLAPGAWEIHDHLSQVYTAMGNTKDAAIERDRAGKIREAQKLKDN